MNRSFRMLSAVTALVATLSTPHCVLGPDPEATTSEPTGSGQAVAPELLSAMRRDLGLTEEQAIHRLSVEGKAPALEQQLREKLGTTFAGAWLNEDGTQLIVGVTTDAGADIVRSAGAEPRRVAKSLAELEQVKARLIAGATLHGLPIHYWYVNPPTNGIVTDIDTSDPVVRDLFISLLSGTPEASGIQITSSISFYPPHPSSDLRGGDDAYFNGRRCSVGFAVNGGFVTAGHCGEQGMIVKDVKNAVIGTVREKSFPSNDYGWVATNDGWTAQPWVDNHNNSNIGVSGSQEAVVGASICRSGSGATSGWRCGKLLAKNVTVNYVVGGQVQVVSGLSKTDACANNGDSGGTVLSGNQAQGIVSGIMGNCTSSNPETFYQPINPILSAYGLTLKRVVTAKPFVSAFNGKCIDVPNADFFSGAQLQMWDCNVTNAQQWTWVGNTVQINGLCMDVSGAGTVNGTPIQLWTCNGTAAQDFTLTSAGELFSPMANKCVDIKEINPNNGAQLHIWDCLGLSNQKWSYF